MERWNTGHERHHWVIRIAFYIGLRFMVGLVTVRWVGGWDR